MNNHLLAVYIKHFVSSNHVFMCGLLYFAGKRERRWPNLRQDVHQLVHFLPTTQRKQTGRGKYLPPDSSCNLCGL